MNKTLVWLHDLLWGVPTVVLIVAVGLFLTVQAGFPQIRLFVPAVRSLFRGRSEAGAPISSRQALCTALAGTVGTGNLVGVAGALCIGGPGAVFWMWICGFLSMAVKYAEAVLAARYRVKLDGVYTGGPMYMISRGLPWHFVPLAYGYAAFGVLACFGVGNAVQVQSVVTGAAGILRSVGLEPGLWSRLTMGIALGAFLMFVLSGGISRIAAAAERMVPLSAGVYVVLCLMLLTVRFRAVPDAFRAVFRGAFHPGAVTGGMVGSLFTVVRTGCARGVFSNEAGLGTASMVYAAAPGKPGEQGMLGLLEVFLDTIVICTLTALCILCSGIPVPFGRDRGAAVTMEAFSAVLGRWASPVLTVCLCVFAVATVLGWSVYGMSCARFLFGGVSSSLFIPIQFCTVVLASVMTTEAAWMAAEVFNALMIFPNLLALAALSPELHRQIIS